MYIIVDQRGWMSSKMKKIKCQTGRLESCFNRMIERNETMLILKKISYKKWFVFVILGENWPFK